MGNSDKLAKAPLPYLTIPPKSDQPVGTLERCGDFWVIDAEPYVTVSECYPNVTIQVEARMGRGRRR